MSTSTHSRTKAESPADAGFSARLARRAEQDARRRAVRRRRLFAALVAVCLTTAAAIAVSAHGGGPPTVVAIHARGVTVARVPARKVPSALTRRGVQYRVARPAPDASSVEATPVAASIPVPVIQQKLRNDCEAAGLSALLASVGVQADQLTLQNEIPRNGPLDPQGGVWGDPEVGFVGHSDGSGPGGGFGVYQRPVAAVALRHGVRLNDITGQGAAAVYSRLLAGHAVETWVGLADGPTGQWQSPAGHPVTVNFGEHVVVVHGIAADGTLSVMNPLTGADEHWSRGQFETMFRRLGYRALAAG